jgi:hypothetical protein
VRELLKELRRLFREKSLRTDWLDFCCSPLERFWLGLEGEAGVRKLSARSVSWLEEVEVDIFASVSVSRSGVGGKKLVWMSSAEVGCDDNGPPPAVGGRADESGEEDREGDMGGVSGGAGMFVPAVREKSTGVRLR